MLIEVQCEVPSGRVGKNRVSSYCPTGAIPIVDQVTRRIHNLSSCTALAPQKVRDALVDRKGRGLFTAGVNGSHFGRCCGT